MPTTPSSKAQKGQVLTTHRRITIVWTLTGASMIVIYVHFCGGLSWDTSWLCSENGSFLGERDFQNDHESLRSTASVQNLTASRGHVTLSTASTAPAPIIYFWTKRCYACEFDEERENQIYNEGCAYKCLYTRRPSLYNATRAVIIEGRQARNYGIPERISPDQLFVYFARESPAHHNIRRALEKFKLNQINFTMTYQRDSDFFAPYDELVPLQPTEAVQAGSAVRDPVVVRTVNEKRKGVLAVISNCHTDSRRENLIAELRRYVTIDAFGKCYGGRCDDECMESNVKSHKFIIAMENSVCEDYVTEKFFRIKQFIVPIVLREKDYLHIAPKGSFIAVDQFESVVHLASHLKMLMNSTKEYTRYFEWTNHYEHGPHQRATTSPEARAMCRLCENLHTKRGFQKVVPDISEWFSAKRRCHSDYADSLFTH